MASRSAIPAVDRLTCSETINAWTPHTAPAVRAMIENRAILDFENGTFRFV
jgi:hypothetical protein